MRVPRLRRRRSLSIATRTAAWLSFGIGIIFAVAAWVSYSDSRQQSLSEALAKLDAYNRDIVSEQESRFQRLVAAHRHATELLKGELTAQPDPVTTAAKLDQLFPRAGDGSRRSADWLFEGGLTSAGYVRGIGGFVGREPSADEVLLLLTATRVIHAIGEGLRPELKSMSFFTPTDTLVMFAPDRPDKLLYYRREAPADMTLKGREFLDITLPANNPQRRTRCTSLQPILYDRTGRTWTTGCMTPIYVDGRYVGGWGSSLLLDDLLASSHFEGLPETDVILVSKEGRLIRHPEFTRQNNAGTQRYLDLTKTDAPELKELWALLRGLKAEQFTGAVPELDGYAAVRRIPTPGWYAVTLQRDTVVAATARRALTRVAITALICLILQASLLFLFLRWNVRKPLRRLMWKADLLAAHIAGNRQRQVRASGDEVRQLADTFELMADEVIRAHSGLEAKVIERTQQLATLNSELRTLAETDPLTGLMNRRRGMMEAEALIASEAGGSLVLFDVDHFKKINDTQGHAAGDEVLKAIAREAQVLMRPNDHLARIGGEEFMILLPGADASDAFAVAERLREAMAELAVDMDAVAIRFTISLGIARASDGETVKTLYNRADEALYEAKRSGRNRTRLAYVASDSNSEAA